MLASSLPVASLGVVETSAVDGIFHPEISHLPPCPPPRTVGARMTFDHSLLALHLTASTVMTAEGKKEKRKAPPVTCQPVSDHTSALLALLCLRRTSMRGLWIIPNRLDFHPRPPHGYAVDCYPLFPHVAVGCTHSSSQCDSGSPLSTKSFPS